MKKENGKNRILKAGIAILLALGMLALLAACGESGTAGVAGGTPMTFEIANYTANPAERILIYLSIDEEQATEIFFVEQGDDAMIEPGESRTVTVNVPDGQETKEWFFGYGDNIGGYFNRTLGALVTDGRTVTGFLVTGEENVRTYELELFYDGEKPAPTMGGADEPGDPAGEDPPEGEAHALLTYDEMYVSDVATLVFYSDGTLDMETFTAGGASGEYFVEDDEVYCSFPESVFADMMFTIEDESTLSYTEEGADILFRIGVEPEAGPLAMEEVYYHDANPDGAFVCFYDDGTVYLNLLDEGEFVMTYEVQGIAITITDEYGGTAQMAIVDEDTLADENGNTFQRLD